MSRDKKGKEKTIIIIIIGITMMEGTRRIMINVKSLRASIIGGFICYLYDGLYSYVLSVYFKFLFETNGKKNTTCGMCLLFVN